MTLIPGTRLGPYEVLAALGAGGMGEVYRARDTKLKRDVALKVLPASFAEDADRLARFQREAELLASLNHPHIAHVYGIEDSGDTQALVMELVDGESLGARIARGPVPVDEAMALARQIADALDAAHERGIVHRDLKPANIIVTPGHQAKVLDFGLAKSLDAGTAHTADHAATVTSPAMTQAGMILGTAAYMSPEQARGRPVDKRSDVWAFGAVLYEMLSGRRAFAGDDVSEVLASVLAREVDWTALPAHVPPSLTVYLKRCLSRDPNKRLRDIGDMRIALDGGFDIDAPAVTTAPAPTTPQWHHMLSMAAVAAIAFAVSGLVAWRSWPVRESPSPTRFEVVPPTARQLNLSGRPIVAVAPDGRSFVYRTPTGLWVRGLADLEPRPIPGSTEQGTTPFFSPDGQWIAYVAAGGLKKIPAAGGAPTVLAPVTLPMGGSWTTPNSILFADREGIMRVSAGGGTPELIVKASDDEQMYGPQLLPNGSVLFSVTSGADMNRWDSATVVAQSLSSGTRTVIVQGGFEARYLSSGHITYTQNRRLFAVPFDAERLAVTGGAVPLVDNVHRPIGVSAAGANYDVSPTGTLVYLVDNPAMRSLVWVNRDGTSSTPVAGVAPGPFEDPRLSPDGSRFLITRDLDIWVYEVESGRNSRVTRNGTSLMGVWNPNGREIAYSSAAGNALEAWIAPADGSGEPRQLTHAGGIVHVDSWSPDGRTLSVHQHRGQEVVILMVPLDRPGQSPVVFVEREGRAEGADFSRDGRHVVYLTTDSGRREVYVRPYPGPGGRLTVSVDGGVEPRWGANGELFYRSPSGDRLFSVSTNTSSALTIGKPTLRFTGNYYVTPTGSPRPQYDVTTDGQRFLMLSPSPSSNTSDGSPHFVVVEHWLDELTRLAPGRTP